jgi:DNA-binding response OmpR family regulator
MNRILVIDDEQLIRESLRDILELHGYEVFTANDGKAGLLLAHELNPDIIIMDVMMPGLDGFTLVKHLRQIPAFHLIPIIFISAKAKQEDLREGLNLGADDYITKPFTKDILLEAVSSKLEKYKLLRNSLKISNDYSVHQVYFKATHEVNTALNGILGSVNLLEQYPEHLDEDEKARLLESIRISAYRMNTIFENNKLIKRIIQGQLEHPEHYFGESYTIDHVFNEVLWDRFRQKDRARIDMDLDNGLGALRLEVLRKILAELISNALKFANPNTKIHISGKAIKDAYTITIRNEGRAFEINEKEILHTYQQPGRELLEQQGMGTGLFICLSLMKHLKLPFGFEYTDGYSIITFGIR